jgi:choline dehydrogenase-like flavoprotein
VRVSEIAIVGGGMVGELTALLLAEHGHQVLLLDRDEEPPDGSPEDDFERWPRPGVPQAVHAHVFRARSTRLLREEAPDVLEALEDRGVSAPGSGSARGSSGMPRCPPAVPSTRRCCTARSEAGRGSNVAPAYTSLACWAGRTDTSPP